VQHESQSKVPLEDAQFTTTPEAAQVGGSESPSGGVVVKKLVDAHRL
jgi:hypothetical protein